MVLRVSIVTVKGEPPVAPLSAEFDETGGSIGREASNLMMLPDPERHLSRVQALIKSQGGEFMLIDQGGNPTSVNGRPLGKGNSALLRDGDQIEMAEFLLKVELLRKAPSFLAPDPAIPAHVEPTEAASTDPLGLLGAAVLSSSPAMAPLPSSPGSPHHESVDDPFSELLRVASSTPMVPPDPTPLKPVVAPVSDDPFAVFAVRPEVSPASAKVPPPASEDPFAAFGAPALPPRSADPVGTGAGDPLGIGLGADISQASTPNSVDSLFDLGGSSKSDPFANSALADPLGQSASFASHSEGLDPLALLMGGGTEPAHFATTARNDAAILNDAFIPPQAVQGSDQDLELELEFNLSPENGTPAAPESLAHAQVQDAGAAFLFGAQPESPVAAPAPILPEPFSTPPLPSQSDFSHSQPATAFDQQALLAAFAKGLGFAELKPEGGMTPALMQQIGVVVQEAVRGTMELLVARAMTKREVRADVTMIVSKNNNPLKFSPDVNFALMQLLQPRAGSGFMSPAEAMRDAYDDLRAHQIGFMAGMRAALSGVLGRFKPEELESRLTEKSFLDSVLPANRKAKLWDLYEQRYVDISREAEDNFHSLFGREFLRAYEEQIDRLSAENRE